MISIILRPDESVSWEGSVLNEIMCHRREFGSFMIVRRLTYGNWQLEDEEEVSVTKHSPVPCGNINYRASMSTPCNSSFTESKATEVTQIKLRRRRGSRLK